MPAFLSYANESTQQNPIGGSDVEISNKSFSNFSTEVPIIVDSCHNVYIHENDFDNCLGCILIYNCTGELRIEDIRARDTGNKTDGGGDIGSGKSNVIQFLNSRTGGGSSGIRRIIIFGGQTEDMINIYGDSGGLDADNPLIIEECHLQSPNTDIAQAHTYASGSGSGINAADGRDADIGVTFVVVRNNSLLDAGQCGIQNFSGSGIIITENVVISQGKLRSNAAIYLPWTGGPFGGGADSAFVDNEVSLNRILWDTNLNGNRIFAGGTYYPDSSETCIFDGGDSTPDPATGLDPQTNILQDGTLTPSDWEINPTTMVFAGGDAGPPDVPTITDSSIPFHGHAGTSVIIGGTNFTGATSVKFDGVSADFDIDSDSQITAIAPAHAIGTVEIVIE